MVDEFNYDYMDLSMLFDEMIKDKVILKSEKGKKTYTFASDPIIQFADTGEIDINILNKTDHL